VARRRRARLDVDDGPGTDLVARAARFPVDPYSSFGNPPLNGGPRNAAEESREDLVDTALRLLRREHETKRQIALPLPPQTFQAPARKAPLRPQFSASTGAERT